ncbi:MAG TPA: alpha/beta fold hydrolase [Longimicrobiales bacterium]|nr:alpha/beta fold hydrolase [Longimicrobiales bacterium]
MGIALTSAGLVGSPALGPGSAPQPVPGPAAARTTTPVLLVPGWLDTARDLAALRIRFLGAGWAHVEALSFEDPAGSNRDHALEIEAAVTRILAESGAEELDIVAHSMGGLATRWFLLSHHPAPVRRVAFLGAPHHGTLTAHLAWGAGGDEMTPGSDFLETLNGADPVPEGVEAITVRTPIDTRVVPGESAVLPGIEDHTVCCPTHPGLVEDEDVFRIVVDFLERPEAETADSRP